MISWTLEKKYSWLKTPRWKGHPVEVGPLARLLVAYVSGREEVKEEVNGALKQLDVPVTALFSTLGRTAARGLETRLVARWAKEFYGELLTPIKNGDTQGLSTTKNGIRRPGHQKPRESD
jgi:hydrogenase large subunit